VTRNPAAETIGIKAATDFKDTLLRLPAVLGEVRPFTPPVILSFLDVVMIIGYPFACAS